MIKASFHIFSIHLDFFQPGYAAHNIINTDTTINGDYLKPYWGLTSDDRDRKNSN